jgi:hypothetical protein
MADVLVSQHGLLLADTYQAEILLIEQKMVQADLMGGDAGSCTTQITYTNRVWDTQAGPAYVRWDTIDDSDPTGVSYPGPGTFGVHTSDYCVEYLVDTAVEVVTHVPISASTLGILLGWTGDSTATDVTASNFVLDLDTPAYVTDGHYSSPTADVFDISTTQLLATTEGTDSGAAFQIPVATDVTFGGMFYITALESTPYFLAVGDTFNNLNYALMVQGGEIKYQTSGGLYTTGRIIPTHCWFHLMCVSQTNRTASEVFLNGASIWSDTTIAGAVTNDAEFYIGNVNAASGDFTGQVSDVLVANIAYTAAQVRTAAENAFGHPLA